MLLTSAFLKENSAISLEECVLVFTVFTTATRKLKVNLGALVCGFFSPTSHHLGSSPAVQFPPSLQWIIVKSWIEHKCNFHSIKINSIQHKCNFHSVKINSIQHMCNFTLSKLIAFKISAISPPSKLIAFNISAISTPSKLIASLTLHTTHPNWHVALDRSRTALSPCRHVDWRQFQGFPTRMVYLYNDI